MMQSPALNDTSESLDGESQERSNTCPTTSLSAAISSSGYYDVDKCRAFIANQTKISKIDRFAAQVCKAHDVESDIRCRLGNILNMFVKRSAQVTHEFTFKCKLGLQHHRQDRILNQQRKSSKKFKTDTRIQRYGRAKHYSSISSDLLYGPGAQLFRTLLSQSIPSTDLVRRKEAKNSTRGHDVHHQLSRQHDNEIPSIESSSLSEEDYFLSDLFEPKMLVSQLEDSIRSNISKSEAIVDQMNMIRQLFERLASEHRDKVDMVYSAEECRQAATVTRRSAYNLSVAAIKATSTPVHVNNSNNNEISWNSKQI